MKLLAHMTGITQQVEIRQGYSIAGRHLALAERLSDAAWAIDFAPHCLRSHQITMECRDSPDKPTGRTTLFLELSVACRRCEPCRKSRARLWFARACYEVGQSPRTWFATLTFAPDRRQHVLNVVRAAETRMGRDFDTYDEKLRASKLLNVAGKSVTLFLKRLRIKHKLRYLLVGELHKDGFPHFHLLIHELGAPIGERVLRGQWTEGFSMFKLVDVFDEQREARKQVAYVCKYISKDMLARVRASKEYGQKVHNLDHLLAAARLPIGTVFTIADLQRAGLRPPDLQTPSSLCAPRSSVEEKCSLNSTDGGIVTE